MNTINRITVDPTVRFGKACVGGTRITVGEVLEFLASGRSEQDLLKDFPQLSPADVLACFAYAALREQRVKSDPTA